MEVEDELVKEMDVLVVRGKEKLCLLSHVTRPMDANYEKYERISSAKFKPKQQKLQVEYTEKIGGTESIVTETSKLIDHSKLDYFVVNCTGGQVVLHPIDLTIQMRPAVALETHSKPKELTFLESNGQEKQDSRKETAKSIEMKMRTFQFQKELLEQEDFTAYKVNKRESIESERFVASLFKTDKVKVRDFSV